MLVLLLPCAACGDTGQERVTIEVIGRGVAETSVTTLDGWQITLEVAEIGIGPVYLCATAAASVDLCPSAVAEFAETATIDALDSGDQALGIGDGLSGETARSLMLDYAIPWRTTQTRPQASSGAPGGRSARFEGRAIKDGVTIPFIAEVDVLSTIRGTPALGGVPMPALELPRADLELTIAVDPLRWWRVVGFDELAALAEDDALLVVPPNSTAANALILGMIGAPPLFELHD